ncbi:MAG: alkaline phosphatase family protein [Opitutaceae bacterium]|nr:alkaline phosphatase family protein [Opitutaceae bacterium]
MNPFFLRGWLAAALILPAALFAAKPPAILPGYQPDGSVLLPNQWSLRPVGRQLLLGDFPVNIALHPSGQYAAILHSGYSQHEIRIVDIKTAQPVSQVTLEESFYGLAWSPDGKQLYASGASLEIIHAFAFAKGYLSGNRELRLRANEEMGVPIGVAVSSNGRALYVAEGWGQRVTKIDANTGVAQWSLKLGAPEGQARTAPDSERVLPSANPDASFPYSCLPDEKRGRVYVSLWAKSAVLVLDANSGVKLARWPVGSHPNELALGRDGRLFVAEANLNTVSVIDVTTGRVLETLSGSFEPDAPPGSMPNSVALAPDGKTLYVANANNNAVAVFDVSDRGRATSLGFIPVGWFPTSVRVTSDGRTLLVANGKGMTSAPNPGGPYPGDHRPRSLQEYIGGLFRGTLSTIDLPAAAQRAAKMAEWTKQALANTPIASPLHPRKERPANHPIPARPGDPSPIKHVIYIVKENRTYDQVLGDMAEGNGEPRLCLFPENVTPNHHALAREFVLLDNFFVDGEVSADGHEWSLGAYASDFVEKTWPLSYGHNKRKKFEYPSEGRYAWVTPARGYLWDQAARAGVTYRSYGEFVRTTRGGAAIASIPILRDHIDPQYRPWDLSYPDVKRAERFIAELKRFEGEGDMPRLQVVRLGNDHTSGTRPGATTPTAMVADNDRAFGLVVEAVSRSKFWPATAIFVLEDDAQNGPDHVDAHRIPAFVISPYTKRRAVDSTLYSTTSMLRTIELILGLQPMSQFDAAAAPMYGAFDPTADLAGYTARPAQVDLEAKNTGMSWGARESMRMNLAEADQADDIKLNEIVWRSVKGPNSPMPAPVRAAFFKAHPKDDKD